MLTLALPAKLNLVLHVGPPLPPEHPKPGFHPIASVLACIDLADELQVRALSPGGPSRYSIEWAPDAPRPTPIDWPLERDLGVRAHQALETHVERALPVEFMLRKRVPTGSGMGGGSADAAGVLRAVNHLFGLGITPATLRSLALKLGSDVPFFVDDEADEPGTPSERSEARRDDSFPPPRPAVVSGLGELIERGSPIRAARPHLLLIIPPCACPTGAVYRALDALPARPAWSLDECRADARAVLAAAADSGRLADLARERRLNNDLMTPALAVEPRLRVLFEALHEADLAACLTGSGSTAFVPVHPDQLPDARVRAEAALSKAGMSDAVILAQRLV